MKLGDILGSISPAFGLISGEGLGSYLKYLSPPMLLGELLGHHGGGGQPAAAPDPTAGGQPTNAAPLASSLSSMGQPSQPANQNNGIEAILAQLLGRGGSGGGNYLGQLGGY